MNPNSSFINQLRSQINTGTASALGSLEQFTAGQRTPGSGQFQKEAGNIFESGLQTLGQGVVAGQQQQLSNVVPLVQTAAQIQSNERMAEQAASQNLLAQIFGSAGGGFGNILASLIPGGGAIKAAAQTFE